MAKSMMVAGVMSGTSADGVDVAFVRFSAVRGRAFPQMKLLGHSGFPYPPQLREDLLRAMEGAALPAAEWSRLHWRLGEVYAECVEKAAAELGLARQLDMVGLHGQTVFHDAGKTTWQIGEAAVVRERLGVPVVSDFRPADVASGGQGAPLVPILDYCAYRSAKKHRLLLNLGGIANVTAIPAGCGLAELLAFDTGPANMVVDRLMQTRFDKPFDIDGAVAASGRVLPEVLAKRMQHSYLAIAPPKSCGREQFGEAFTAEFATTCRAAGGSDADSIATATEWTAASIVDAYERFCRDRFGAGKVEVIAAGGGVKNSWLMGRLRDRFAVIGVKVKVAEDAQAKEAVAFALLAWLTFHGKPGNVPAATGALGPRILGKISW
jgi:anhydro-N-acetylmuramic acid kinase